MLFKENLRQGFMDRVRVLTGACRYKHCQRWNKYEGAFQPFVFLYSIQPRGYHTPGAIYMDLPLHRKGLKIFKAQS